MDSETASQTSRPRTADMKLEVVVIPVSDVDRAKRFYGGLGWRLDADFAAGDDYRVIQFTPPGSPCSVIFGKNVTAAAPGSAKGLYLIVSDIAAAATTCVAAVSRSARYSMPPTACTPERTSPFCLGGTGSAVRTPGIAPTAHSPPSVIPTATAGCCRRSPRDCPDASTPTPLSARRPSLRRRFGVLQPRTASTRSGSANTMRTGRTGTRTTSSGSRPARSCRHERLLPTSLGSVRPGR